MEEIKLIGLNIWGIRGGFRSFCHSENLDIEAPEIKNTWKDIRDFVYVSNLGVRFYALEFTPNYKVFTLYRPVNDTSRTGAYVGTTLYVPHQLRLNNTLDVLKQISDAYYKDHYDAFGNPNTNPDYMPTYQAILNGCAGQLVREAKKRTWEASAQDNTPKILPYTSPSVVDHFFSSPYRHEFVACQEVMFWDNNFLQDMQTSGVKFQKSDSLNEGVRFELDGKDVRGQFDGGRIMNQPGNGQIVRFVCNGNDITQSWQSAFFDDGDMVEIILRKANHNDVVSSGALIRCGLFKKSGVDYHFVDVNFVPKTYKLMFSTPGVHDATLYFNFDAVQVSNGIGSYDLKGNQLNDTIRIALRYGNTVFGLKEVNPGLLYNANTDSLNAAPIVIEGLKTYRFQFSGPCQGSMEFANKEISFATNGEGEFDLVLPSNVQISAQSISVKVEGFDALVEPLGDYAIHVRLTRNTFNAIVFVPSDREIVDSLAKAKFSITVAGNKYVIDSSFKVAIPKRFWSLVKEEKAILELLHGTKALPCKYSVFENNGNDLTLTPELQLIHNATDVPMTIQEITIPAKGKMVWPVKDLALKGGFETTREQKQGYQLLTLKKKAAAAQVVGANTKAQPERHGSSGNIKGPSGGRDRHDHYGDSDEKRRRLFLYGGIGLGVVLVTLLVLAIVLGWFGGGKKGEDIGGSTPKDSYTVEVKMDNGTQIESIQYKVQPSNESKKVTTNWFSVDKDFEALVITVKTKGEGTCEQIELKKAEGALEVVSGLEQKTLPLKNDKAVLALVSPAWERIIKCGEKKFAAQDEQDFLNILIEYSKIAKDYESVAVKHECADLAYKMLCPEFPAYEQYRLHFNEIPQAKPFIDQIKEDWGDDDSESAINKREILYRFEEKLRVVWSVDCNKNAIEAFSKVNDSVNEKIKEGLISKAERDRVVIAVCGDSFANSKDEAWIDNLIVYQKKMTGFDGNTTFDAVKTNIEKPYFSDEQKKIIKQYLLKDSKYFSWYRNNRRNNMKDAAIYSYVNSCFNKAQSAISQ